LETFLLTDQRRPFLVPKTVTREKSSHDSGPQPCPASDRPYPSNSLPQKHLRTCCSLRGFNCGGTLLSVRFTFLLRQLSAAAFVLPSIGSRFFITQFVGACLHHDDSASNQTLSSLTDRGTIPYTLLAACASVPLCSYVWSELLISGAAWRRSPKLGVRL
jgi:hypothetical protein